MEDFVASQCCYGSAPAKEMQIRDITPSSAYHVRDKTIRPLIYCLKLGGSCQVFKSWLTYCSGLTYYVVYSSMLLTLALFLQKFCLH